jgi:hypothetical protein
MSSMYSIDDLNFKCLVCGEKLPTKIRTVRMGNIESGDYERDVEFYDTSQEAYFVRADNSEILRSNYESFNDKLLRAKKDELKKEIENNVLKEDFRRLLENKLFEEADEKFKRQLESFQHFLYRFGEKFEKSQPSYALDLSCSDSVLKNVEGLEKQKYVVESGVEKVLRIKASLDIGKFSKAFPFVSNFFDFNQLGTSKDNLILEFGRFSEFPLV